MDGDSLKNVSHLLIDPNDYEIMQMIGNGSYGAVYLVKDKKTGALYSMKYLQCQMMNHIQKQYLTREIGIMAEAAHPALLSLRGFSLPSNDASPVATIITDYMSKGSLFQMIQLEQQNSAPPEYNNTKKNIIIIGIAAGIKYLHSKNIMHRDLKPENILLNDSLEPHIGDFGLSKLIDDSTKNGQANTVSIGTPLYMAPEIFTNSPYDFKVDVYAFGMILYEILTSISPFKDITNPMALGMKICNGERPPYPPNFSTVFQVLIDRCWASNPDHRPMFDEILEYLCNPQVFVEGADLKKVKKYIKKVVIQHSNDARNHSSDDGSDYNKLLQIIQNNTKTIESLKNEFKKATNQFKEETKRMQKEISELKKEESTVISELQSTFQSNQELLMKLTEEHQNLMLEMQKLKREASYADNAQQSPSHYSNPSFPSNNPNLNLPPPASFANSSQQQNILRQQQQQQQQLRQPTQQQQQQKLYQHPSNSVGSKSELNSNLSSTGSAANIPNFRNQIGSNPNLNPNINANLNQNLGQNLNHNLNSNIGMKQNINPNLNPTMNQNPNPKLNPNLNPNSPGLKQNHNNTVPNYWNGNQPRA